MGKSWSKKNKRHRNYWANKLDESVMALKDNETHGILIGPHASNLISEIILVVIDNQLIKGNFRFIRHIDDYKCYVSTYDEGERFLNALREELRKFDLVLNYQKTKIQALPIASDGLWTSQLLDYSNVRKGGLWDFNDARGFLNLAKYLWTKNDKNSSVLLYAMKVLASQNLRKSAELYVQKVFLHLAVIHPYLIRSLQEFVFDVYKVPHRIISDWVNSQIKNHMEQRNYEAVSNMFFFGIKYKFKINNIKVSEIINQPDCVLKVISYIYFRENKDFYALKKLRVHAENLYGTASDAERNWLFIYEALPSSRLHDEWKKMKQAKVSFIR